MEVAQPDVRISKDRCRIVKTNEEFKQHEERLMQKRINELNNSITQKCHMLWNEHLSSKPKPMHLAFTYEYNDMGTYLAASDRYVASEHKDSKQKWWNNQKASEMSHGFLPSVLEACDQMAQVLASYMDAELRVEFANLCMFELLETAITAVFSTSRSGSNEIFLRTAFQYSKSELRRKLVAYFTEHELSAYSCKQRRKKETWRVMISTKKQQLLAIFCEPFRPHSVTVKSDDTSLGLQMDDQGQGNNVVNNQRNCGVQTHMYTGGYKPVLPPLPWMGLSAHSFPSEDATGTAMVTPHVLSQLAVAANSVPSYQVPCISPPELPPLPPLPVLSSMRHHPYASHSFEFAASEAQALGYRSHRRQWSPPNENNCISQLPAPQRIQLPEIAALGQAAYHDHAHNHANPNYCNLLLPAPSAPERLAYDHQNDQSFCLPQHVSTLSFSYS